MEGVRDNRLAKDFRPTREFELFLKIRQSNTI